jgi:hypothetical protein
MKWYKKFMEYEIDEEKQYKDRIQELKNLIDQALESYAILDIICEKLQVDSFHKASKRELLFYIHKRIDENRILLAELRGE